MSKRKSTTFWIALALGILFGVSNAHATAYTLDATIQMDDGVNFIDINPVTSTSGSLTCLAAPCDGPDYLIFEVSVISGSFEEISGSLVVATPEGLGFYTGPDTDPSNTSTIVGGIGRFDFDTPLLTGDSNILIISYNTPLSGSETASFSVTPFGSPLFSEFGVIITPIPEPDSIALLALGLVAVGMGRRKQRRLSA